jgi:hypothetical protein
LDAGSDSSPGGEDDYGEGFIDEGVGAVLHFAGGVAFGVDVGDFLELERAFESDGEVDAAAEVEEVARGGEAGGELLALGGTGAQDFFDLAGDAAELLDQLDGLGGVDAAAELAELEREAGRAR